MFWFDVVATLLVSECKQANKCYCIMLTCFKKACCLKMKLQQEKHKLFIEEGGRTSHIGQWESLLIGSRRGGG